MNENGEKERIVPKCYCCGLVDAEVKDYRTFDDITSSYLVCKFCFGINSVYFRRIHYEDDPVEKRMLVREVLFEEFWEMYGVTDEDIEKIQNTRKNVISWKLTIYWDNGESEEIADLPDWVADPVDEYLSKIEEKTREE